MVKMNMFTELLNAFIEFLNMFTEFLNMFTDHNGSRRSISGALFLRFVACLISSIFSTV